MARTFKTQYVAYRGEDFLDIGTADELSQRLNQSVDKIYWQVCAKRFKTQKHKKSTIIFYRVEDDE